MLEGSRTLNLNITQFSLIEKSSGGKPCYVQDHSAITC